MAKLFVVIVTFNSAGYILKCLESLKRAGAHANIVIVDNASIDGGTTGIKSITGTTSIKIIRNKENLGFAGGSNIGIRYALKEGATHVLLLNPDTVVRKNLIKPLFENGADIVGPVIKFKRKGEWTYDLGGVVNFFIGRTSHNEVSSPTYISGACMLVKKAVFKKIGLFDERFFLYFEDVDFCLRAKKAGFSVCVEPRSQVVHKLSEGRQKPLWQHLSLVKSNFLFINKHMPLYTLPIAYIYLCLLTGKILYNHFVCYRRLF